MKQIQKPLFYFDDLKHTSTKVPEPQMDQWPKALPCYLAKGDLESVVLVLKCFSTDNSELICMCRRNLSSFSPGLVLA